MVNKSLKSPLLLAVWLILAVSCSSRVGRVERFIREDPLRCASNLHRYEIVDSTVTPAPKGYVPFYVSHIGRHGCRGHNEPETFNIVDTLLKYRSEGLLTEEAGELTSALVSIRAVNEKCGFGELTDRGALEHREIARRLGEHYPEIFQSPERPNVRCYSTMVKRVTDSRDNFAASLKSMFHELEITLSGSADNRFCKYQVGTPGITDEQKKEIAHIRPGAFCDSILKARDWSRLVGKTFARGVVPEGLQGREWRFFNQIHWAGAIRQCYLTDTLAWVEPYFNQDELYDIWQAHNAYHCQKWEWTEENRGYKARSSAVILRHIIDDAEAVIAGADTCGTFRFSHDGVIQPLMCLMGLDWSDWHGSYRHINEHCCMAYTMHMAGNIQLIFFRGPKDDVLVKILQNEEETVIPALKPDRKGVFYDWDRLRTYLESTMQ